MLNASNLFSVAGKNVLVTGGGTGIGYMIAEGFVSNGANVFIASRKEAQEAAKKLNEAGPGKCRGFCGYDLNVPGQPAALADEVKAALNGQALHVLVNNSGANWAGPFNEYPDTAFDKVLGLNVKAVFSLSQALMPLLEQGASVEQPGVVINIGSIDGIQAKGMEHYAYGASKAAVHHLTRVMAGRLGPRHITVNAIAPGPFQSKMMRATLRKFGQQITNQTALGRIGSPEDMAGTAIWLSSRAGAFVTGTVIVVDGGVLVKPAAL